MMEIDEYMELARRQAVVVGECGRLYRVIGVFTSPAVILRPLDGGCDDVLGIGGLTERELVLDE
jgi:hypothetical protein